MALKVKLQVFEGPLDLLLFLIERNKVDINDIPIAIITDQYLEYIQSLEQEDMNVVSEFMLMAATLIDIKCKMLLPREINEEGEEEDPRAELVQKLLEYKMYKYMSYELKDRHIDAVKNLFKKQTIPKEIEGYKPPVDYNELLSNVNLAKLQEIFESVMKKQEDKIDPIRASFGKIEKEEVDMDKKSLYIEDYIAKHQKLSFKDLLQKQNSKAEVIVTFLVILEMMKIGKIDIRQEKTFDDIEITRKDTASNNG